MEFPEAEAWIPVQEAALPIQCPWCGAEVPAEAGRGACAGCADRLAAEAGLPIQTIIDGFPFPVLVVDEDVTVTVLNRRGQEILGVPGAGGQKGGELFGCAHAHLPGGCGRSLHCSGCALRRAVTATFQSRRDQVNVPATLKAHQAGDPANVSLTFTTCLRGSAVLVKIDSLDSPFLHRHPAAAGLEG